MSSRIVIASFGSYGDVNPYIGLALGLRARGHRPVLALPAYYRAAVEREGLDFHPVRPDLDPDDPATVRRIMDPRRGPEFLIRTVLLPHLRDSYDDLADAARDADFLVGHPLTFAVPPLAQSLGIPWASSVLAPLSLASAYDPPIFGPIPGLAALRRSAPRLLAALLPLARRVTHPWMAPVRGLRASLGLPPGGHPMYEGQFAPGLVLAMFSSVLAPPQRDWPSRTRVTGPIVYDGAHGELPAEVARFLEAGTPPVVFTLGSSAVAVAGDFYRESVEAVRRLGVRAILLVGRDSRNDPGALPPNVVAVAAAPHSALFPRASVIVHQGGAGTLAQALRAGRPMLVVPRAYDQPDNAFRAERLGVARSVAPRAYRAGRVARLLRGLLDRPAYADRAAALSGVVRSEHGCALACDAIEAQLGIRPSARTSPR